MDGTKVDLAWGDCHEVGEGGYKGGPGIGVLVNFVNFIYGWQFAYLADISWCTGVQAKNFTVTCHLSQNGAITFSQWNLLTYADAQIFDEFWIAVGVRGKLFLAALGMKELQCDIACNLENTFSRIETVISSHLQNSYSLARALISPEVKMS